MYRQLTRSQLRWLVVLFAVSAYFVIFPEDVATVLGQLTQAATSVLSVSQAVSPWLYAFAVVAVVCWTAVRIWGRPAA